MKKLTAKRFLLLTIASTLLTACNSSPTVSFANTLSGIWRVEKIQETPIIFKSQVKLIFHADGRLTGKASCNNFLSHYNVQKDLLAIKPMNTTRKMCTSDLMQQESKLLKILNKVRRFQSSNDQLSMFDQQGHLLLKANKTKK